MKKRGDRKQVVVISLGGSLIVPDDIDVSFLRRFKKIILKNIKNHKFIIACGGGSIARKYISALRKEGISEKLQSFSGISATRSNARFMSYFFNKNQEYGIPHSVKEVKNYVKNQEVVFCGALEYKPRQTSDSTAAQLAQHFRAKFINLTNVAGLYTANPKTHKDAKLISSITWKKFNAMAGSLSYKPGQHFVLDQTASIIILKNRIPTYILGQDMKQLGAVLKGKKFRGTLVEG